ncbi:unnamed protein product, partial [Pylaiella littoralis]
MISRTKSCLGFTRSTRQLTLFVTYAVAGGVTWKIISMRRRMSLRKGGVCATTTPNFIRKDFNEQIRWTNICGRPSDAVTVSYRAPKGYLAAPRDSAPTCLHAFGKAGLEWVSPGLYREMVSDHIHAEDARGQGKGDTITEEVTLGMITTPADTNHDTAKNGMEKVARKNMLASIASTNNTVVQNHKIMTVYKTIGVRIGGEGSSYCKNKGDKHTSNSVYFCMNSSGMYHKCFYRKDTIGVSGKYCKAFASTAEPIPIAFRRFLFKEE